MGGVRLVLSEVVRLRRFSRIIRARIGAFAGGAMSATGVGYLFGLGWALIVGGVAVAAYFLVLYDVDEPTP